MARGSRIAWSTGLVAIGVLALSLWSLRHGLAAWWRWQTVKGLLDPARRQQVYREVVSWQRYRGEPRYRIELDDTEQLVKVIECPQRTGSPVLSLFFRDTGVTGRADHFELVDYDGTLLPVPSGSNVSNQISDFQDINGDGLLDRVEAHYRVDDSQRFVHIFRLVQVTPSQDVALEVAYIASAAQSDWTWQLHYAQNPRIPEIVIGPKDPATSAIAPRAVYQWDSKARRYVGPEGGVDQDFIRVDTAASPQLEEFAKRRGTPAKDE